MAFLHYGSDLRIQLDLAATKRAMETIGSHASRGGWVTATDVKGRDWSLLVSAGIPLFGSMRTSDTRGVAADDARGSSLSRWAPALQVMRQLIEADVSAMCGPMGEHDAARIAVRHGTDARSLSLSGEEPMPAHELFCSTEPPGP